MTSDKGNIFEAVVEAKVEKKTDLILRKALPCAMS
jgi:hypothetical protein